MNGPDTKLVQYMITTALKPVADRVTALTDMMKITTAAMNEMSLLLREHEDKINGLTARLAKLESGATPQPAPKWLPPADHKTFRVDWSKLPRGHVGRWCRYAFAQPDNTPALVAFAKQSIDLGAANNVFAFVGWDLAQAQNSGKAYAGDARLAGPGLPESAWKEICDYAHSKGMRTGITLTGGLGEGGWYPDRKAFIDKTAEVVRYHKEKFGNTFYYLDANQDKFDFASFFEIAAQNPDCVIIAENWDNATSLQVQNAMALWDGLGNGGDWYSIVESPAGFAGCRAFYANQWYALRDTEKVRALPLMRSMIAAGTARYVIDLWPGAGKDGVLIAPELVK